MVFTPTPFDLPHDHFCARGGSYGQYMLTNEQKHHFDLWSRMTLTLTLKCKVHWYKANGFCLELIQSIIQYSLKYGEKGRSELDLEWPWITLTLFQSASISSATTWGREVRMPCPISARGTITVIPLWSMISQGFSAAPSGGESGFLGVLRAFHPPANLSTLHCRSVTKHKQIVLNTIEIMQHHFEAYPRCGIQSDKNYCRYINTFTNSS